MHPYVRPNQFLAFKLPSEQTRIQKIVPNTEIFLGKYGSFPANQIIGRPFYLTYEIHETPGDANSKYLRIVTAAELHAESLITDGENDGDDLELNEDGTPVRTNRETVDDRSTQKLTLEEIEALKKESSGAGRAIIAKLLESHQALDQKTAFSLAKYKLRKERKYMKRFTVMPLDVSLLTNYMLEDREAAKTLELRDELIGLIGCWGNVHHGGSSSFEETIAARPNGRYLVVDDTGGLVVAAMAERMGMLYPHDGDDEEEQDAAEPEVPEGEERNEEEEPITNAAGRVHRRQMSAQGNTITLLHANKQPNLNLLKYFGYEQDNISETHPLYTNLKTVSFLQLLDPNADTIYAQEPPVVPDAELATYKSSKRSSYHRKRGRWMRTRRVVDEARTGGFDGLIIASMMDPGSILKHAIPLLSGSAPVVIYSPTVEPLTEVTDLYSTARKNAWMTRRRELEEQAEQESEDPEEISRKVTAQLVEEFYVDPTTLLSPTLQTSRVRVWQVLPGRTHPLMSGRGGAEGYIFHGIRVIPRAVNIEAAGDPARKRRRLAKQPEFETPTETPAASGDVEMTS
ncbi:adenine-N(1)--methyltransferase non-catalytic subunit trm6 [Aspergillus heteromorphus CBS 117.55]|uniref:tRNA (adenine(58)-N(1))-methyltransferase non-catalytic subunit TRM6 n=1 Tax=Aspergillus heteromorphus CBS 117.55 TaxID=1448321 RepID=A0A317X127_9EURO|nr:adenine-N(1)--methyltransferase non-catalytic subunit trm6 [Aspergillus heteromorphus CBS 117.55]PWY92253.1 adenine-N(1)--methyltransferase non-catalytic subunit trm6 [Aspergillus heteromorphus CBS 117.55]